MANPFLFDEVPAAEPANPFLMNDAPPAEPANPFLMDGGGMGAMQPQASYGAQDAANPFASYATPMYNDPNAQMGSYYYQQQQPQQQQQQQSAFLAQQQQAFASPHHQQAFVQPQPPQQTHAHSQHQHLQQFSGQYGTYTQVTADSFSQPAVSSAFVAQQPPEQAVSQAAVTAASFAAPAAPLTGAALFGVVETVEEPPAPAAPEVAAEPPPPPPPPAEVIEEPMPPPAPTEEDVISLPPPPAEVLPIVADEPLPAPPEEAVAPVRQQASEDEEVEINFGAKEPGPEPDFGQADDEVKPAVEDSADEPKEEGFGQIFNKPMTPPSEPELAVAMADPDLPVDKPVPEPAKPKSYGASLFGVEDEPAVGQNSASASAEDQQSSGEDEEEEKMEMPPTMSTGEAIFADLPSVPNIGTTGASLFGMSDESAKDTTGAMLFGVTAPRAVRPALGAMTGWDENFDKKFDLATKLDIGTIVPGDPYDPFGGPTGASGHAAGFGADEAFGSGSFMPPVPQSTPAFARKVDNDFGQGSMADNPFLSMVAAENAGQKYSGDGEASDDGPLFDDDTSQPLEQFPRLSYDGEGWEMYIRHPPKKKLTSHRFWKKVYVKIVMQAENPCVQLFDTKDSKDPFQELPLQPAYSVSDISHQVFDQYTKIFTVKLQYIFYKERAGIRPGQISKMQKLAGKVGFLAKAVEDADYEGVKEFASDMKKLGVPLEHAPQVSELLKLGSHSYDDLKQFTVCIEEKLWKMDALRDRSLTYKTEEIQLTAIDEVYVEQTKTGHVVKQLCRVRVFFLSFLTGMPDIELGVNDITRMGLEVVGRHDILPIPTEQWIRYEDIEFHSNVDKKEFETNDHIIKFKPPDACYIEVMRFRVRPPKARELPMQARCIFEITGNKVVIRADMMIPYPHTKAWGQVPCEDVAMRIPLPECWIYQFRTEKHHVSLTQLAAGNLNLSTRMGSVKSAHRRAGKVKGIERFLGALESQTQELMETSSGQAKYEHQHRAIVWRIPRLPKHGQGSYTNHEFICRLQLTSFDQIPENFDKHFFVEFTQPATCISNTVLRSVSVLNGSGEPPEKFVKYLARHEYKLEIEFTEKELNTYAAVVKYKKEEEPKPESPQGDPDFPDENGRTKDSDSDSD